MDERMPDYCSRCLEHQHEGLCERWWNEDLQQYVRDDDPIYNQREGL